MHHVRRALVALLVCIPAVDAQHTNPLCWDGPRIYAASGDEAAEILELLSESLSVDRGAPPIPTPFEASPHGAYAFALREDPIDGLFSGATRSEILVFVEEPTLLRIALAPVHGVRDVHWTNERLLYFRVWLGRFRAADVLVDVEEGAIVHRAALLDGGALLQQVRDTCARLHDDPACSPSCHALRESPSRN